MEGSKDMPPSHSRTNNSYQNTKACWNKLLCTGTPILLLPLAPNTMYSRNTNSVTALWKGCGEEIRHALGNSDIQQHITMQAIKNK
ncbi:hypothetical protein E2C01_009541 [Portunus trituberculatus]|uniref:Uncharacterized protein n=1 Tax=Portunus trituberculatus TaxID=210409 RepID=A0A5B7D624_PORTR|nr:hypothetical protein [Portunus trituberculatus]